MNSYTETVSYLYNRLPLFSRTGADAYKKDLHNIRELCTRLRDPHHSFRTIHVAGTNGKGSTSHMLAAILQEAGYKTGLYTSPHLQDFRERIRINGQMIPEEVVVKFTQKTMSWYDEIDPSFFEITVAMAFDYFAQEQVDVAVIEVGLGGRLDSTNIITPELSVITNIGWDHMQILGDTLEKIASEKAGIIKSEIPVVVGETHPLTEYVFRQKAMQENSPIIFADQLISVENWSYTAAHQLDLTLSEIDSNNHIQLSLDLPGVYQLKNARTVWQAVKNLRNLGWSIEDGAVQKGLARTRQLTGLGGRWEVIYKDPVVVLDVGHNEDGIQQILEQLKAVTYHQLHLIIGMVKDKDVQRVLALLPTNAMYYFTQAAIPRALPATELATIASTFNLVGEIYPDVNAALEKARNAATKKDLILVCGSVFLVGEVKRH